MWWSFYGPGLIARRRALVSVDGALQVGPYAQANASRVHEVIYSGFGGQTDFVVGALHSPGGRGGHRAAVVAPEGGRVHCGPATSFRHGYIVTEQGTATIWS